MTAGGNASPAPARWPWAVAAASTLLVLAAIPWAHRAIGVVPAYEVGVIDGVVAATVPWVGALIVSRRARHRVGWVLLAQATLSVGFAADAYYLHATPGDPLPAGDWAAWLSEFCWVPFLALPTLLVLWFPTGEPPSRRWRIVQWAILTALAVDLLLSVLGPRLGYFDVRTPLPFHGPSWTTTARDALTAVVALVGIGVCVPAAVLRLRGATGELRQQLRWFVAALPVGLGLFLSPLPYPADDFAGGLGLFLIVAAIAVAVLRYRLYDLGVVLDRTLVFAATTAVLGAAYLAAAWLLNRALAERTGGLIAAVLVAAAVGPIRTGIRRAADRLLFGDRADPYLALSRLGRHLQSVTGPEQVPAAAAEDIRRALRVPHVRIDAFGQPPVDAGEATGWPGGLVLELTHQGISIGRLEISPRHPTETFSTAEVRLIEDLARNLGTAVHAAQATRELQRSREQLVAAREEERRRLHRDLHDGLGPTLGAAVLAVDGVRTSVPEGGVAAGRLDALKRELQEAVGEVRRVVYELRPPALEAGLVVALDRHVRRLDATEAGPRVRLRAGDLPTLPPAVEVAAYRLAAEALSNAVRHSRARTIAVELATGGQNLTVRIIDDGTGIMAGSGLGVGLPSMRARAEEIGGTLVVDTGSHGTAVTAQLPLGSR